MRVTADTISDELPVGWQLLSWNVDYPEGDQTEYAVWVLVAKDKANWLHVREVDTVLSLAWRWTRHELMKALLAKEAEHAAQKSVSEESHKEVAKEVGPPPLHSSR